ncbi:molybdate ABC transporter substrate-binding protein [Agromyces indicus]|uniref:Molybdate ABC transporter substrate-binding protein n=1 Tax=Agromyces indicus TaxID=758919 RepID=A0ABU1FMI0_9MICO|nr:molybdate ABC transporter substrate-binding protein [Agromyces indicus]MDR5692661.1 molybdate ABC transporter substrate-binding protein [Agromyces indicus]
MAAALAVGLALAGCAGGPASDGAGDGATTAQVRIAAAADLKFALEEVVVLLQERHPEVRITTTYGSSGTFLSQISNGAPFDVFLSADLAYPRQLVEEGLADEEDVFPYAVGRLVLWAGDGGGLDPADGLPALASDEVRRVAIANPAHAPYGVAAVEALRSAGVLDEVEGKLVYGENVAQAAEFVQSGNADAGIVALSLVRSDPLRGIGAWAEVPLDAYPRLDQGGVVLRSARDPGAAALVRDAILSPDGADVLARYGFSLPGATDEG